MGKVNPNDKGRREGGGTARVGRVVHGAKPAWRG